MAILQRICKNGSGLQNLDLKLNAHIHDFLVWISDMKITKTTMALAGNARDKLFRKIIRNFFLLQDVQNQVFLVLFCPLFITLSNYYNGFAKFTL